MHSQVTVSEYITTVHSIPDMKDTSLIKKVMLTDAD